MAIARETAGKLLFYSNRTCCVCRQPQRPLQIHHIDGERANHVFENLAVLCLECHTGTQKKGGFYRKLDAAQVRLYRNEWLNFVGRMRVPGSEAIDHGSTFGITEASREQVAATLLEHQQYEMLARHYHLLGDTESRDKYVELALADPDVTLATEVALRLRQNRLDVIPPARLHEFLSGPHSLHGTLEVVQVYRALGRDTEALLTFCDAIAQILHAGNRLLAAVLLKRLENDDFTTGLLQEEFRESRRKGLIWMQVRCLQELHWEKELRRFFADHRDEIESSPNLLLRFDMYKSLQEHETMNQTYVALYADAVEKSEYEVEVRIGD
jgi:hypothetical protein